MVSTTSKSQSEQFSDEIRIVQSVQAKDAVPAIAVGTCTGLTNTMLVSYQGAISSGAIYLVVLQLLLLVPILQSYRRLRNAPRPKRVSRRRIRRIEVYSLFQGLVWAGILVLIISDSDPGTTTMLLWIAYIMVFGVAILVPTVPLAGIGYAMPIAVGSFAAAIYFGNLETWVLIFFGIFGVLTSVWAIWDNWKRLINEVSLSLANVEAQAQRAQLMEDVSNRVSKYISPQLFKSVFSGEQSVEIASKRKKLTVFFSDIVNFTEITDQLESEELTALLNRYLTEMSHIALEHGGTVDKFIGDAIVVYFGDPETLGVQEDAHQCVRMALAMQARVQELRREWIDLGLERTFELRIGINTGYCTVGNFGSKDRMDYTIIGNEVNLAARLESAADVGGILLANETNSLVKDLVKTVENEPIAVKGFARPVRSFRVVAETREEIPAAAPFAKSGVGFSVELDAQKMSSQSAKDAEAALNDALNQLRGNKP